MLPDIDEESKCACVSHSHKEGGWLVDFGSESASVSAPFFSERERKMSERVQVCPPSTRPILLNQSVWVWVVWYYNNTCYAWRDD